LFANAFIPLLGQNCWCVFTTLVPSIGEGRSSRGRIMWRVRMESPGTRTRRASFCR
jgi:hypothetical protein